MPIASAREASGKGDGWGKNILDKHIDKSGTPGQTPVPNIFEDDAEYTPNQAANNLFTPSQVALQELDRQAEESKFSDIPLDSAHKDDVSPGEK